MVTTHSINIRRAACRGSILVDVIVGSVILGLALTAMIGLVGRAISEQNGGEQLQTASMLIDEQLALVLARGPDNYATRFDTQGTCDAPFDQYRYELDIQERGGSNPYFVRATVFWDSGGKTRSASVETLIAARPGEVEDRTLDQSVTRTP
ncbi:MAG: hypothetical protein IT432_08635 [Phycisphaerales bacterium]|nr:hypothetical protein [Phycisphaerales bacterium]